MFRPQKATERESGVWWHMNKSRPFIIVTESPFSQRIALHYQMCFGGGVLCWHPTCSFKMRFRSSRTVCLENISTETTQPPPIQVSSKFYLIEAVLRSEIHWCPEGKFACQYHKSPIDSIKRCQLLLIMHFSDHELLDRAWYGYCHHEQIVPWINAFPLAIRVNRTAPVLRAVHGAQLVHCSCRSINSQKKIKQRINPR